MNLGLDFVIRGNNILVLLTNMKLFFNKTLKILVLESSWLIYFIKKKKDVQK